jgi:hypothetical protein
MVMKVSYKGKAASDVGYYYAPYIPSAELIHQTGEMWGVPYFIILPYMYGSDKISKMVLWCQDSFGSADYQLHGRWWYGDSQFWFRDAADRDWFALKWS